MTRFWDGRTDGLSDCTPRPAFAFGDAGKKGVIMDVSLNFVPRQNESKIRHITFQNLVQCKYNSFKFFQIQTQVMNDSEFYRINP